MITNHFVTRSLLATPADIKQYGYGSAEFIDAVVQAEFNKPDSWYRFDWKLTTNTTSPILTVHKMLNISESMAVYSEFVIDIRNECYWEKNTVAGTKQLLRIQTMKLLYLIGLNKATTLKDYVIFKNTIENTFLKHYDLPWQTPESSLVTFL